MMFFILFIFVLQITSSIKWSYLQIKNTEEAEPLNIKVKMEP